MKSWKKSLCRAAFALSVILIGNSLNFSVSAQDGSGGGQTGMISAAAEASETETQQETAEPESGVEPEVGAEDEQEPETGVEPESGIEDEQKQETDSEDEQEQEAEPETDIEDPDGSEPTSETNLPEEEEQTKMEPVCAVCGGAHEDGDCPVEAVRNMLEELPDVEDLKEMGEEERAAAYDALQEAYDAYCGLTEEERALLAIDEDVVFGERFALFIAGIMLLDEGEPTALMADPEVDLSELKGALRLRIENDVKQYSADGGQSWTDYSGSITLKGKSSAYAVEVVNGEHDVIMNDVTLTPAKGSPFAIEPGASVNMTLSGTNEVAASETNYAGIQVPDGAALTITKDSTGSLTATGGSFGAGIGGGNQSAGGCITIKGGTVNARGGEYGAGAGIGGGYKGEGGTITISGGVVVASGGSRCDNANGTLYIHGSGAGIGGGSAGAGGGKIEISGGTVMATGGASSAGIGSGPAGKEKKTTDITISGGTVIAQGDISGAGIGGGYDCPGGIITISGGTIIASGGRDGAGIGGGYWGAGGTITVSGGNVKATAGEDAVNAIGAGYHASGGTPKDGNGNSVSLVTITLAEAAESTPVTFIEGAENYGLKDVCTLDTNKLYLYLPSNVNPTAVTAAGDRYTGTLNSDRTGTFTRGQSDVICVEITWGAMEFTYTDGIWNPETLTYEAGGWKAADGTGGITVKNTGTKEVMVSYEYEPDASVSGVSGSFADEGGAAVTGARELAAGEEKKTYLKLEGKPENIPDSGSFSLGAVIVRLGGD